MKEHVPCNLCGQDAFRPVFTDHKTGFGQGFCQACGLIYVTPRMDAGSRAEFYATYGQKYPESFLVDPKNPYRQIAAKRAAFFEAFSRGLSERAGSLLEVGCSYGFFLEELEKKGLPIRTYGLDPSRSEVEYARRVNGLAHVRTGLVEDLKDGEERFDAIALFHVLEHLGEPMEALRIIHGALREGGLIWVEVPEASRLKGDVIEYQHFISCQHLYEFSLVTLKGLLERAGFERVVHEEAPLGHFLESNQRAIYRKASVSGGTNIERDVCSQEHLSAFRDRVMRIKGNVQGWLDSQVQSGKPVFIYGGGFHTMGLLGLLEFPNGPIQAIQAIIDDDEVKHGTSLEGLPIRSPSVLDGYAEAGIVISTLVGEEKMAGKLLRQKKPGWDIKAIYRDVPT
jgi:SAM-dependent methyltransferase